MKKRHLFFFSIFLFSYLFPVPYRGGELRTNQTYRYGRFETRMKAAPGSGVVNSFFLYRDYWSEGLDGAEHWNEIDIELLGQYTDKIQTNLFIQNGWDLPQLDNISFNAQADFHTYAIEWTPEYISFFVDDMLIRFVDNFYVDSMYHHQKIMMNIWQPTAVSWVGPFDENILPVYAFYDWVKYYAYVPGTGNAGTDNDFIQLWQDDFDYFDNSRWSKASHTFNGNNADFTYSNVVFESGYMILCLTTPSDTGYNGGPLEITSDIHPASISIENPYPNPFNGSVVVPINIMKPSNVQFTIYDLSGGLIFSSSQRYSNIAKNQFFWDGENNSGDIVSSGAYLLSVKNKMFSESKKILFIK